MAASGVRVVGRQLLRRVSSARSVGAALRRLSIVSAARDVVQSRAEPGRVSSPWKLTAAVCLHRLPVISQDRNPVEEQFAQLMYQMELENSLLADHELQLLEDAERLSRKQSDDYDSDEEGSSQEIVLKQDLEDSWEQRLKNFQPASRVQADVDQCLFSPERCLTEALVVLVQQQVESEKVWLFPQTQWREGENLRQTAERALTSVPVSGRQTTFLGNAPCGVYKYKLPKAARTENFVGVKTFFFKAIVSGSILPQTTSALWLKYSELQAYLRPTYLDKVQRFILHL